MMAPQLNDYLMLKMYNEGCTFTLREFNVYKPHGFFLGFLATFICFGVTVLFYRYLYLYR